MTQLKESDMPEEREWKLYFPHPEKTLRTLGLKRGMVFADLGCGYGIFTIPAAEIVGRKGLVYAVDIDSKMVDSVLSKSRSKKLTNIRAIVSDITTFAKVTNNNFPRKADFVLLANVIHGTRNKVALLKSVSKILTSGKRGRRVVVLNWKVSRTPRGPPMKIRPTEEQTVSYLVRAGYRSPFLLQVPPYHYAVIANV